jgi:transcriptional regulator with XRE-family HTH domain
MSTVRIWTGHEARLLRLALRLSLRAFAARLGVSERAVSKWERAGREATPWPDNQSILDTALAQAPEGVRQRFTQLMAGLDIGTASSKEDAMRRRALLHTLLAGAGAGLSLPALSAIDQVRQSVDLLMETSSVSPATLAHWERVPYVHALDLETAPPAQLLAEVVADFAELSQLLRQPQTTKVRMTLCRASGQLAQLAGALMSRMGERRDGVAWFRTARLAAHEAGDTVLVAGVAAVSALRSWQSGAVRPALAEAEETRALLAGARTASAGQVRGLLVEARALARTGRTDEARRRLGEARDAFARLSPDDMSNTLFGHTERQHIYTVGRVYVAFGQYDEAERHFDRALPMFREDEYYDLTLIQLDRARHMVAGGAAADGCRHAATTLAALPEELRAGVIHEYRTFVNELPANVRALPATRELRDLVQQRPT